ncbi:MULTISPECIES: Sec-independent protein translocase subunit TatA [Microbacterium]|uniref:Sec-independent protein translocase protein TatA n=1 Tax=Microbacterium profundi TaxID=450380 RepID=A0ABV3LE09_9MICO|nr:Sec-independent protein translocase subunit TatA [Microbacterium profundi]MCE7480647.1 Sec-independent protein translocase subunit TatA [Microbacterium profundi]
MMAGLTGWHLLVLVLVILLLFGAAKLPALAKSMGQSARLFKGEMKAMKDDDGKTDQTSVDVAKSSPAVDQSTAAPRSDSGTTT